MHYIFSIHASAKEATLFISFNCSNISIFNPRLREGGDIIFDIVYLCDKFFNPRLREGGDSFPQNMHLSPQRFSIHASAKEATLRPALAFLENFFQSTPPRRRRPSASIIICVWISFQSTPPRRRRLSICKSIIDNNNFSIHASAKEATFIFIFLSMFHVFQSTPPRRRRQRDGHEMDAQINFQSTPPRRRRQRTRRF